MRLFAAGVRKLIRRPATYVTFGLLVGLLALILLAVGATAGRQAASGNGQQALLLVTFPGAYTLILSFILGLGGLFAIIYGAAIAGSEWTWGTLKAAVARGESRSRYQLLSFAAIACCSASALVIAFVVGVVVAIIGASLGRGLDRRPERLGTLGTLPELLAPRLARDRRGRRPRVRDRHAGPQPARGHRRRDRALLRRVVRRDLPARHRQVPALQRRDRGRRPRPAVGRRLRRWRTVVRLEPYLALLIVAAWLIGALVVTALWTERAEISG